MCQGLLSRINSTKGGLKAYFDKHTHEWSTFIRNGGSNNVAKLRTDLFFLQRNLFKYYKSHTS